MKNAERIVITNADVVMPDGIAKLPVELCDGKITRLDGDICSQGARVIDASGCFVLPGTAFLPKAGPLGTTVGMLIGALLIIVIAVSYGYLINKFPISGGEFVSDGDFLEGLIQIFN